MSSRSQILLLVSAVAVAGMLSYGYAYVSAQQIVTTPAVKATPTPTPRSDEDEVIKVDTEVVNVLFTAQDQRRRLLTDLKQADVSILEDGKPQEITAFSRQVDLPLSL